MGKYLYISILICIVFGSCRTTHTSTITDTNREASRIEYRDRLRIDSVFLSLRDSIYIRERGDTVFIEKFHTQIAWRDRLRVDTLSITDTVRLTRTETHIEIEEVNRLTGWQWFQVWLGRIAAGLILLYFAFKRFLK